MIDEFWVPSWVHASVGGAVLLATLASALILVWRQYKQLPVGLAGHISMVIAQITLMIQALIGIKLLDQGLGPLQLYIHYVGGLAPLAFYMAFYWLPASFRRRWPWTPALVSLAAFTFATMAFFIGRSYVAG